MEERQLFDRNKLMQQLQSVQHEQTIQGVHNEQPATVYGAERTELERAAAAGLEAAKRAAAATKASEQGRSSILKGLAAGADIYALFMCACDTISKTTGDTVFFTQAGEYVRDVYGKALGEKPPLRAALDAVQTRAERIKAYMEREDIEAGERETARRALQAHQRAAAQIMEQLRR